MKIDYKIIKKDEEIQKLLAELSKEAWIAFDFETSDVRINAKIHLLSISTSSENYLFYAGFCNLELLKDIFEDSRILKIAHNAKFDIKILMHNYKMFPKNVVCTMLQEQILQGGKKFDGKVKYKTSLDACLYRHLQVEVTKDVRKEFIGYEGNDFSKEALDYTVIDTYYLYDLYQTQKSKLIEKKTSQELYDLEKDLLPVIAEMELNGIFLDQKGWQNELDENKRQKKQLEELLLSFEEINWGSSKQVGDYLQKKKFPNLDFTEKGAVATGTDKLEKYLRSAKTPEQEEVINLILSLRKKGTLVSSFGEKFLSLVDEDGRIRANYFQIGAASGRFSCSSPNMQQIPSTFRKYFVASPGYKLISADYSSQELIIMYTVAKDYELLKKIKKGLDAHSYSAELLFAEKWAAAAQPGCLYQSSGQKCSCEGHTELRKLAKAFNFALPYGMGTKTFAASNGLKLSEAKQIYDSHAEVFPLLSNWMSKKVDEVSKTLFTDSMPPYYRRRYLSFGTRMNSFLDKAHPATVGKNHVIQATGADMIKHSLLQLDKFIKLRQIPAKIIATIHDEIVFEVQQEWAEKFAEAAVIIMQNSGIKILGHDCLKVEHKIADFWTK